jgi:predicted O-methyltransferase YrrM
MTSILKTGQSVEQQIRSVYQRDYVVDRSGTRKPLAGAISLDESLYIANLIQENKLTRTMETGVANGLSALAMTLAAKSLDGHHTGIDPCQRTHHNETALVLLEEFGVQDSFSFMDGPAHLEVPKLINAREQFDLIFIDGMHLFDFKLIDVFLSDLVLRDGGWLLLHDLLIPSVKKTTRFIARHKDYRQVQTPALRPSIPRRLRYVAGALLKGRPMWYWWPNGFSNLLVLQKQSTVDHKWNFFRNF